MKSSQLWFDKVRDKDNNELSVWDVCFNPDGSWLIVACGTKVLVYVTSNGTLLQPLKGHKDIVYCVSFARDGKKFASGSADKTVIIWSDKLEGIVRYSHSDAVQCLAFNPVSHDLVSGCSDLAVMTNGAKTVQKVSTNDKCLTCSWTNDGQYLAVGHANGTITIRNKELEEKVKIERPNSSPVWTIEWCPNRDETYDTLAVADLSQTLSYYHLSGKQVGKDRQLNFDPCQLTWFPKGQYLVVCGSNKQCYLFGKDGTKIGQIAELPSWVMCASVQPNTNCVAVGSQDGTIGFYQLNFSTIHGLHKNRYAYRDNMTDVVIQHLITDQKVRVRCRDLVRKVAIYKRWLAILLPEKLVIYELGTDDPLDMQYRVKEKVYKKFDCHLLFVCSQHVILCQEKKLQCLTFKGICEREWILDSPVRFMKVLGGPSGREGLIVGLRNGQVLQIFIDNAFPIQMIKLSTAMKCLDVNLSRSKLAVVDEHSTCLVYNIKSKELLYQEPNATSVVWNTQHEEMLCYSGSGLLSIKVANFPVHQQKLQGVAVAFSGSSIYCLNGYDVSTVAVPHSASMYQYLERKSFRDAYDIACLGVTNADWDQLAHESLEALELNVASKAFSRTKNYAFLSLVSDIEERRRHGDSNAQVALGDVYALEARYSEAARLYKAGGMPSKALNMYSDLRMFDLAKEFVGAEDTHERKMLMTKQADWASNLNDPRSAAQMYITAGEYSKAIDIIGEHGWADMLIELARKLDKADEAPLRRSAMYFARMNEFVYASEIYNKLGDTKALVILHVDAKHWDEALDLAKTHPEFRTDVYLPYAQHLAEQDKFELAQQAFHQAGLQSQAVKVLEQLTRNAVVENRFSDAGYYYWKLSMQCLELSAGDDFPKTRSDMLSKFHEFQRRAEMYYAYHSIHRYTEEPFTSHQPDALFNISRFLWHCLMSETSEGISKVATLYTLAKHSRTLGALKLARYTYEKLESLRAPVRNQDAIDLGTLMIRAKAFHDNEDLLPFCYRCSTSNPLLNTNGNICVNCRQPFVFSFVSFEVLPLVEFFIDHDITDKEAVSLLELEPNNPDALKPKKRELKATIVGEQERLDEEYATMFDDKTKQDPFNAKFVSVDPNGGEFQRIVAGRDLLRSMSRTEVLICTWPRPLNYQYFKIIMLDVPITKCSTCNKIFHKDDYELQALQLNHCPFCRTSIDE